MCGSQEAGSRDGNGPGHGRAHKLLSPTRTHLKKLHHLPTMPSVMKLALKIQPLFNNQFHKLRTKPSTYEPFAGTLCIYNVTLTP